MRSNRALFLSALLLLMIPSVLFAQASGAALSGRVMDVTGGGLPGVTVTATNNATGFNRTVTTAPDGSYRFPSLPVGTYNVLAELAGFGSVTTRNVELNVADRKSTRLNSSHVSISYAVFCL